MRGGVRDMQDSSARGNAAAGARGTSFELSDVLLGWRGRGGGITPTRARGRGGGMSVEAAGRCAAGRGSHAGGWLTKEGSDEREASRASPPAAAVGGLNIRGLLMSGNRESERKPGAKAPPLGRGTAAKADGRLASV